VQVPWLALVAAVQDNTLCVGEEMWYLSQNAAHKITL